MRSDQWENLLSSLIKSRNFTESIEKQGFYPSPQYKTFRDFAKNEWHLTSTVNTAMLLSIDFWSKQPQILTQNRYYLIRTGEGSFAILSEDRFPRPYLNLKIENAVEMGLRVPEGFGYLRDAFKENILENTALEQLRFNNILGKLVSEITGTNDEFFVGPRGNTTRTFTVYMKDRGGDIVKIKEYTGQAELDYTVWTKDSVLLFEAKKSDASIPLDIGWHKLAYAAIRFKEYVGLKIHPVYFVRLRDKIIIFSFPEFRFHKDGIILNDEKQMMTKRTFLISLE